MSSSSCLCQFKLVSGVLTEFISPVDVIFDILVADGGLDSVEGRHEVIHAHRGASQFCWVQVHKSHILTFGVGWESRGDASAWGALESLGRLTATDGHHQSLIDYNCHI